MTDDTTNPGMPADDLADANPGLILDAGWATLLAVDRARMVLRGISQRILGAAEALHAQQLLMGPSQSAAVGFVANTLRDQANMMRRALDVQSREAEAPRRRPRARPPSDRPLN